MRLSSSNVNPKLNQRLEPDLTWVLPQLRIDAYSKGFTNWKNEKKTVQEGRNKKGRAISAPALKEESKNQTYYFFYPLPFSSTQVKEKFPAS
jgi:hypothetical protein